MRPEATAALIELLIQALDVPPQRRAVQIQPQIAHAQPQQLLVGQARPVAPAGRARRGGAVSAWSQTWENSNQLAVRCPLRLRGASRARPLGIGGAGPAGAAQGRDRRPARGLPALRCGQVQMNCACSSVCGTCGQLRRACALPPEPVELLHRPPHPAAPVPPGSSRSRCRYGQCPPGSEHKRADRSPVEPPDAPKLSASGPSLRAPGIGNRAAQISHRIRQRFRAVLRAARPPRGQVDQAVDTAPPPGARDPHRRVSARLTPPGYSPASSLCGKIQ